MAQPYIGEIRQAGFNFAPPGWLACLGQTVNIADYDTLFNLIGTTYGGDGVSTFGIPDLRGRAMIHQGQLSGGGAYFMGQRAGTESLTLTQNQMAGHSHTVTAKDAPGTIGIPTNKSTWAQVSPDGVSAITAYSAAPGNATLASTAVSVAGSSLPIDIRQPYVVVNFIIATVGIYPSPA